MLHKRKDGYHEIETLFERIALFDKLTLAKSPNDIFLTTDSPSLTAGKDNLIVRAAILLKERYKVTRGVRIHLEKHIPISAGLGGGSSNAATTILALNRFWKLKLSRQNLFKIGAEIGSDVPFFIMNTTNAFGSGRGEKLNKVALPRKKRWYCLVKPPFGISTREAYEGLAGVQLTPLHANVRMLVRSMQKGDANSLAKQLTNSLELVLNKRVTEISKLKENLLREGALAALLSGSGSSVFGLFSSENKARLAARHLVKKYPKWWVQVVSSF